MKKMGKIMLFLSSYLLLFLILLIREIGNYFSLGPESKVVPVVITICVYFVLCLFSIASVAVFKRSYEFSSQNERKSIVIKNVSSGNQEIVSYLLTIVVPFIGDFSSSISSNDWVNLMTTLLIIFFISIIYVNSNLVVVNPLLVIFGYSINKIYFTYIDNSQIDFEGVLLTKNNYDITSIQSTTIVHEIDEHTFFLTRV